MILAAFTVLRIAEFEVSCRITVHICLEDSLGDNLKPHEMHPAVSYVSFLFLEDVSVKTRNNRQVRPSKY